MTYRNWLASFFAALAIAAVLLIATTFAVARIVREPDFAAKVQDPSVVIQEHAFTLHGKSCDVLIDGDSTASTGVDPRVITQQTGLTACNIATPRPIWDAYGTYPLDTFLANNPKPKVLVLQFGPEYFYRATTWDNIPAYAPYVLVLRHGTPAMALRTVALHPSQTMGVIQVVLKARFAARKGAGLDRVNSVFERTVTTFNESGGRMNVELPPLTACDFTSEKLYSPLDTAWIDSIRRKYQAMGIVTLVDASPIPACDSRINFFKSELQPSLDGKITTLPIGMFIAGGRHFTAEGASAETTALAQQINAVLAARTH